MSQIVLVEAAIAVVLAVGTIVLVLRALYPPEDNYRPDNVEHKLTIGRRK